MEVNPLPETVICRPDKTLWLFVVVFGGMGLLSLWAAVVPPHRWDNILAASVMGLVLLTPSVWLALLLLRARVIADDQGLRWRMIGRWWSCRWDEITDYYEVLSSDKHNQKRLVMETQQGHLNMGPILWEKAIPALRKLIEQNATQAMAQKWEIKGTRRQDKWPHVFHYKTLTNYLTPWVLMGLISYPLLCMIAFTAKIWQSRPPGYELGWDTLALIFGFLTLAPIFWLALYSLRIMRPRFHQHITVNLEGLVYEQDNHTRVKIVWADVTAYGYKVAKKHMGLTDSAYAVITDTVTINFLWQITEAPLLQGIIRHYATNAAGSNWDLPDRETLGGPALRWSGGKEGVGARVFHYRKRPFRVIAGGIGILAPVTLVSVLLNKPSDGSGIFFAVICAAFSTWMWM